MLGGIIESQAPESMAVTTELWAALSFFALTVLMSALIWDFFLYLGPTISPIYGLRDEASGAGLTSLKSAPENPGAL